MGIGLAAVMAIIGTVTAWFGYMILANLSIYSWVGWSLLGVAALAFLIAVTSWTNRKEIR